LEYLTEKAVIAFIDSALNEDIGDGDHSSLASIPINTESKAKLIIKGNGILAGVSLAKSIVNRVDSSLNIELFKKDGDAVFVNDIGFHLTGNVHSILKSERLILNCMQRMSGIAAQTHNLVKLISHTKAKLLDTRKTTPNFRLPEKWAVKIGGGENHRLGLYDMIMLKDNHIDYAGGIKNAITSSLNYLKTTGRNLKIEVETRTLGEVQEVISIGGIHRIMLDNMDIETMTVAVNLINSKFEVEASGGITEETIVKVAETGVDFISVGALTHSIKSMDISLKAF